MRALVRVALNIFMTHWVKDRPTKPDIRPRAPKSALHQARTLAEAVSETARDDIVVRTTPERNGAPATPSANSASSPTSPANSAPSPVPDPQQTPLTLAPDYRKRGIFYTDEYFVYRQVLPASRHRPRPKGHGATSQVDRAYNTFRQWYANLVRKPLSFSRDVDLHTVRLRLVIDAYNAERAGIW
jgi:hypothetical protein